MSDFDEILNHADPVVAALASRTKELILKVLPAAIEIVWPKQKIISYGIGPKKMTEHFCYIAVLKDRINLGFYYGSDLKAPAGLMEGTGKALRHIKISSLSQLDKPEVLNVIRVASKYLPKLAKRN